MYSNGEVPAGRLFCSYQGDMTPHKKAAVRIRRPPPASCTNQSTGERAGKKKRQISVPRGGLGKKSLPPKNWPCKAQLRPI